MSVAAEAGARLVDLTSPDLVWGEAAVAGAEVPVRSCLLHADEGRGTRTALVAFGDGWRRDAAGTQTAGEEVVPLRGALAMSGLSAAPGECLVITPRALRSATSTPDGTRALIWFTGPPGGWVEGDGEVLGTVEHHRLAPGFVRASRDGLAGHLEFHRDVASGARACDVEVVWPHAEKYAYVPAGAAVPSVAGLALVRVLD